MAESEPPITFQEIRARAYELWDRNHRPDGLEVSFWLAAERELKTERADRTRARAAQDTSDEPGNT